MGFFGLLCSFIYYRNVGLNQYSLIFLILNYMIYVKIPFTEKEVSHQISGFDITAAY